jgi:hypothetical protein
MGSGSNVDKNSSRALIRRFDISDLPPPPDAPIISERSNDVEDAALDFVEDGIIFAEGLRNAAAMTFDNVALEDASMVHSRRITTPLVYDVPSIAPISSTKPTIGSRPTYGERGNRPLSTSSSTNGNSILVPTTSTTLHSHHTTTIPSIPSTSIRIAVPSPSALDALWVMDMGITLFIILRWPCAELSQFAVFLY